MNVLFRRSVPQQSHHHPLPFEDVNSVAMPPTTSTTAALLSGGVSSGSLFGGSTSVSLGATLSNLHTLIQPAAGGGGGSSTTTATLTSCRPASGHTAIGTTANLNASTNTNTVSVRSPPTAAHGTAAHHHGGVVHHGMAVAGSSTTASCASNTTTAAAHHACVSIDDRRGGSTGSANAAHSEVMPAPTPSSALLLSDHIPYAESDGIHTQHFQLAGNRLLANTAKDRDANGGQQARVGPTAWQRMYLTLMPEGYPNSVTPDYLVHQIWDAFNFASYNVMATLATRAMLKGVGVGSNKSTVLSGTLAWLLKDVSALLSSIGFAVKLANDLDNDAKQWRMFADITTDIGLLLEVYSEHLPPGMFILVICIASMFRSVWTVAGWSSRVALTQHFAIRNNTADVSARNGAQETLFTLVGMLGGMYMAYVLSESSAAVQAFYFIGGTLAHLYFNYKSVKSLILTNFNKHRALICINRFLANGGMYGCEEANALEPVVWWREPFAITFGARPSELKGIVPMGMLADAVRCAMRADEGRRFALLATIPRNTRASRIRFDVILREGAGDTESFWAFFLACKVAHFSYGMGYNSVRHGGVGSANSGIVNHSLNPPSNTNNGPDDSCQLRLGPGTHLLLPSEGDGFTAFKALAVQYGWEMDKLQFRVFDWRVGTFDAAAADGGGCSMGGIGEGDSNAKSV